MSVLGRTVVALEAYLKTLPSDLAAGPLAVSLVAMAELIDDSDISAHARSLCQGRLADGVKELRALTPPKEQKDGIDQLAERRDLRRRGVGGAETSDLPGS